MNAKTKKNIVIRTRIAPSPTGWLHIGTARTALFSYLFAKHLGGKFILRIEDTDLERSDQKFTKEIVESLNWLGIKWDEGPKLDGTDQYEDFGDYGPYYQTKRTDIYEKHISKLVADKKLFWCYHLKEELDAEKQDQMSRGKSPRHICSYFDNPGQGSDRILRFRVPHKNIVFDDLIRGKLEFDGRLLGDIGVARDERTPLYNLAAVIDDYEMKISHVIRGEDHISNTPKQLMLGESLGFTMPQYAHLPLILGADKSKLSKRHGAVAINEYKNQGYLAEALINFMAFLGWNPGTTKEIFSMGELVEEFLLERVQKGGAIFNLDRLDWLNGNYIRRMDTKELTEKIIPFLKGANLISDGNIDKAYIEKIVKLEQGRMKKLFDITQNVQFFFKDIDYDAELLKWKDMTSEEIKISLKTILNKMSRIGDSQFTENNLSNAIMPEAEIIGDKGKIFWPLRVALTGLRASAGPLQIAEILGKQKTIARLEIAINKLS